MVIDVGIFCIFDFGYEVVDEVYKNNIKVVVIFGISVLIVLVFIVGISMRRFCFEGFLFKKKGR